MENHDKSMESDPIDSPTTQRLFTTGWEGAPNTTSQSALVTGGLLDGWNLITRTGQYDKGEGHACDRHGEGQGLGGGKDGFEIWSTGDRMVDEDGHPHTVSTAPGNGSNWLELNDAGGSQHQTLGISRTIQTGTDAIYTLGLDVAGRLGYHSEYTRIGIWLDDKKLAMLDNTSPAAALAWQHEQVSFTGDGKQHTLRIVTEASEREHGGRGMMIDNISLDQATARNRGNAGSYILLQGVEAELLDTDGSETLHLALAGLPIGSVLTDGTNSTTITADQLLADITDWDTQTLSVTAPVNCHGAYELQVMAVAMESANGSKASAVQTINLQVDAVAQTPVLNLLPPATHVSRQIIETDWEGYCNPGSGVTVLERDQLEGWHTQPVQKSKKSAFMIWSQNDQMTTAAVEKIKAQPAPEGGKQWLALSNGIDSGADKRYQNLGIEREIDTVSGAQYTLSLNYAGALATSNTRIVVTLDGQAIGSYANESGSALNWQTLNLTFTGDGKKHELAIQLEAGGNTATGAMLDAIKLVETFPNSPNTVYGIRGTAIALPGIVSNLAAADPGTLKTELMGLPKGSIVTDGIGHSTIRDNIPLDVTGWQLDQLKLTLPNGTQDNLTLQIRATCTEENGTAASTTKAVAIKLLDGKTCTTPVGLNAYVSYIHDTRATNVATGGYPKLAIGPLKPEDQATHIAIPGRRQEEEKPEDSDDAFENWMKGLEHSLNKAFMDEIGKRER